MYRIKIVRSRLLIIIFTLGFSGYYIILMVMANFGLNEVSRIATIPIRLIILVCLGILYNYSNKNNKNIALIAFWLFAICYFIRIIIEAAKVEENYYMNLWEFILYFIGFVCAPLTLIQKIKLNKKNYQTILKTLIISGILFAITTIFYYGYLIGNISRISLAISNDENYISPLALSYVSSLIIGISLAVLLTDTTNKIKNSILIVAIISSLVPFFLGASRGSVIALVIPFIIYFIFSRLKQKFLTIISVILLSALMIYASRYLGTGIFDRLDSLGEELSSGSVTEARAEYWRETIRQFSQNIIFGNSLQSNYATHYPHNLFLEVLITTGIVGFIPFIIFIGVTIKNAIRIFTQYPQYLWLTLVFFQAFFQNMVSGAIWGASWLAIGAGLINGFTPKILK